MKCNLVFLSFSFALSNTESTKDVCFKNYNESGKIKGKSGFVIVLNFWWYEAVMLSKIERLIKKLKIEEIFVKPFS
jgi:hypothetical protein